MLSHLPFRPWRKKLGRILLILLLVLVLVAISLLPLSRFDASKRSCCPRRPGPMLLGGWSTIGPTSHALIPSHRRQA